MFFFLQPIVSIFFFFFFQAEDGIRDGHVTGVQTCALPILTLRPVRNVRLRTITCPREPADVVRAPLGPIPGPLRISTSALSNNRITRITLTASASRTKTYAPPETGTLEQRAAWTLTFVRLQH